MSDLKKRQSELAYMLYANGIINSGQYNALLVTPASHDTCEMLLDIGAGYLNATDALSRITREAVSRLSA